MAELKPSMIGLESIPAPLRRAARAMLPDDVYARARESFIRRRYVKSMVSREGVAARIARRHVSRRRPTLFHLDFHVTDHCNLGCKGCEHYASISPPRFAEPALFERDMARLSGLFETIGQIYLMGGEPLLHPEAASFVRIARRYFPDTRVCLMTNGVAVPRMPEHVWATLRECDAELLCDRYPIAVSPAEIDALGQANGVCIEWMPATTEFFKIPVDVSGRCDGRAAHRRCAEYANCALLHDGRLFPCGRAAYAHILAERFGLSGVEATEQDSIPIFGRVDGDRIIRFLMRPIPWCAHCDFDALEYFSWERSRRRAEEWLSDASLAAVDESEARQAVG